MSEIKETSLQREVVRELLKDLLTVVSERRAKLVKLCVKRIKRRRVLSLTAGALSILSAGGITIVVMGMFGGGAVQILSAIIAAVSGFISLYISTSLSDEETLNMLGTSREYLELRENIKLALIDKDIDEKSLYECHKEYQKKYNTLDGSYSRFLADQILDEDPDRRDSLLDRH